MADKTVERTAPTAGNTVNEVPPLTNGKMHGKGEEHVPPIPAAADAQKHEGNDGTEESNKTKKSPFDQYYSQLIHQQNMLQDSVRVTAYQRAICENAADFKVRMNGHGTSVHPFGSLGSSVSCRRVLLLVLFATAFVIVKERDEIPQSISMRSCAPSWLHMLFLLYYRYILLYRTKVRCNQLHFCTSVQQSFQNGTAFAVGVYMASAPCKVPHANCGPYVRYHLWLCPRIQNDSTRRVDESDVLNSINVWQPVIYASSVSGSTSCHPHRFCGSFHR